MTISDAIVFGLRPPYVTETAAEYFLEVVEPFIKKATEGFSGEHKASSYRTYHWFKEPSDVYRYFVIEEPIKKGALTRSE